jgi:vacuolar protein sorting-associated protein 54
LQEAQQVLDSLEAKDSLDGFNLLAVVANPRGFHHERSASSLTRSSSRGSQPSSMHGGTNTNANAASDASISFTDSTLQAFENTLIQMTEQVDVFTDTLDSWSREYLGGEGTDLEYVPPDTVESLIQHLPEELQTLELHGVQAYLEHCGRMAHKFTQQANAIREDASSSGGASSFEEGDFYCEETIAPIFFQSYFDLFDPSTFCQLLVLEESADTTQSDAVLSVPTDTILKLPPPDFFTPGLDAVEVALLNQVRIKSTQFFHETNRFGVLQQWISDLVKECKRVKSILESSMQNSVRAWELIPQLDQKRCDLVELEKILDQANDVVRCKSSIGGLLSAGQDLHAAEQIQYGRTLLASQDLARLAALSTVEQQLAQYETLVVANLGDELIEIFLDWNNLTASDKRTRVPDLIRGLELCRALPATGTLYGNRLMDVIRMTVRTTVGEFAEEESDATVKKGVTSMTLERFMDCLDMLFEQLLAMLKASGGVCEFCQKEGIAREEKDDFAAQAVTSAAELSSKSISELLRLRKDAHSLVSLEEMKRLWDVCMSFTAHFESLTDYKATGLRSTLLSQAKAFVERKHESNMSSLVAALESERWTQCDVSN